MDFTTNANLEGTLTGKDVGRYRGRGQVRPGNFSSLSKAEELKKNANAMISVNIIPMKENLHRLC